MVARSFIGRPWWQQIFIMGLAIFLVTSLHNMADMIQQRYNESIPGARMSYVNLRLYAYVKRELIEFGVKPESTIIKSLDRWGEKNYLRGIQAMSVNAGEHYIWYYLRHLFPYPKEYDRTKLAEYEQVSQNSLKIFNQYFNAPLENTIWLELQAPYRVGTLILANYMKSNSLRSYAQPENLRKFVDVFYYSILHLVSTNTPLEEQHIKYYIAGLFITEAVVFQSKNMDCKSPMIQHYIYLTTAGPLLLQRAPNKVASVYNNFQKETRPMIAGLRAEIIRNCSYKE